MPRTHISVHSSAFCSVGRRWVMERNRMEANGDPRVVLVHDWLTGMRGGEKCLEVVCRRWPEAPLFTLLHRRRSVADIIERRPIRTSFIDSLPGAHRYYRYLLPFMPAAVEAWR